MARAGSRSRPPRSTILSHDGEAPADTFRALTAGSTLTGTLYGVAAGALWGLVFVAPEFCGDFGPLQQSVARYLFYGAIALLLIAPRWNRLRPHLTRHEWFGLLWLALAGNVVYYILLASAVQMAGIALSSLVVGFLPVTITIIGSRDKGAVPLTRLIPSLLLCVAGAACIGWQAMLPADGAAGATRLLGLLAAIGALLSWTCFAVGNARWLNRLEHVSEHDWSLLTGVVTGGIALLIMPLLPLLEDTSHDASSWIRLALVSAGIAIFASIIGNALWNRMSRLLPLTLVGQMILFETLFAIIYACLWEGRLPTLPETAAFVLLVMGVLACLAAHRPRPGKSGEALAAAHPLL